MEAAVKAGVKKFVLVTSIGCGESKAGTPPNVYEVRRSRISAARCVLQC